MWLGAVNADAVEPVAAAAALPQWTALQSSASYACPDQTNQLVPEISGTSWFVPLCGA